MQYTEALKYIHGLERFGIRPGLDRVRALCAVLGDPQERVQCIHVAGTNGKGSTCAMLSAIFCANNTKTGLYTSPYVVDFRERLQINGEMISRSELAELTARLKAIVEENLFEITEFEFITALAFEWFAQKKCDIVVLETGLGGRYDATNVIKRPKCSIITKISIDHSNILGNTEQEIAREKCGIIKPECSVVTSCEQSAEALAIIKEAASAVLVPDAAACKIISAGLLGTEAVLCNLPVFVPFFGEHMCKNAMMAISAARCLGVPDAKIQQGIARAKLPGRMEIVRREPLLLLDGGHNPDGGAALAAALRASFAKKKFTFVCGMMADKDVQKYLSNLLEFSEKFIACQPKNPRAMSAELLAKTAKALGFTHVAVEPDPVKAMRFTREKDSIVCGSFYLIGEILKKIEKICEK